MSRNFTKREKILLLILCALLLATVYYQFVVKHTDDVIRQYDTADLEAELMVEQSKADAKERMLYEMENNSTSENGIVASYNNIKNEIRVLNDIFADASDYNITFEQAMKDGDAVRRNINVTFTAGSYNQAKSIIKDLRECKYRCLIKEIDIETASENGKGIKSGGKVNVSLSATFFETMYDADTTLGLEEESNGETAE